MKLEEICDLLQLEIEIRYTPQAFGPWITTLRKPYGLVFFKKSESDIMNRTCTGWGKTLIDSLANFSTNFWSGELKVIVVLDSKDERQTLGIPQKEC